MKKNYKIYRKALSQNEREQNNITSEPFELSHLSIIDLMALTLDYSKGIIFHLGGEDESRGLTNWSSFLLRSELFIFASIIKHDTESLESEFVKCINGLKASPDEHNYVTLIENFTLLLLKQITSWYVALEQSQDSLSDKFLPLISESIHKKMKHELSILEGLMRAFKIDVSDRNDFEEYGITRSVFLELWGFPTTFNEDSSLSESNGFSLENKANALGYIKYNFYYFVKVIKNLKEKASIFFNLSMSSNYHSPQVGLFVSFLKQYGAVQKGKNELLEKIRHFYYNKVLKVGHNSASPDSAYIVLQCQKALQPLFIVEGSVFSAIDDDKDVQIDYESKRKSRIVNANIEQIHTLFLHKSEKVQPESIADYVTDLHFHTINTTETTFNKWSLFGSVLSNNQGPMESKKTNMGLAVTSPVLLLREGYRKVSATIHVCHNSWLCIVEALTLMASALSISTLEMYNKIFPRMFRLKITTTSGWEYIEVKSTQSSLSNKELVDGDLLIDFELGTSFSAVIPFDPTLHSGEFDAKEPVLVFEVNNDNYMYSYSLLKNVFVEKLTLSVSVTGVKDLQIHTDDFPVEMNSNFLPFGAIPSTGKSLIFGAYEMRNKLITHCDCQLDWIDLPKCNQGFSEYYDGYSQSFDNDVFKVKIATLHKQEWLSDKNNKKKSLFDPHFENNHGETYKSNKISSTSVIQNLPLSKEFSSDFIDEELFRYSPNHNTGFFKMSLVSPDYAFGHAVFNTEIMNVLQDNLLNKAKNKIPQTPYTPKIREITLNYSASDEINVKDTSNENSSFYHCTPFRVYGIEGKERIPFIESYNEIEKSNSGSCYIGISPIDISGEVSLYFNMQNDSIGQLSQHQSTIAWSYLDNGVWLPLSVDSILHDSTEGFMEEGVVVLDLPQRVSHINRLMKEGYYWIRIALKGDPSLQSTVKEVLLNGIEVTRIMEKSSDNVQANLPMNSISECKDAIPEITNVLQLNDSKHGTDIEKDEEFQLRVRERLFHKGRVVSNLDYERVILSTFPFIHKVKCFINLSMQKYLQSQRRGEESGFESDSTKSIECNHPGHVLCVVIPEASEGAIKQNEIRRYVNTLNLGKIQKTLLAKSSPFVSIEVANPTYEVIQIRCAVCFKEKGQDGYFLQKLQKAISSFLSPWDDYGKSIDFYWSLKKFEVEKFIYDLEYVQFVTDLSMLHLIDMDRDGYTLFDTEKAHAQSHWDSVNNIEKDIIEPLLPWSLPIPMDTHYIEVLPEPKVIKPESVGIKEIEIGKTFIIQKEAPNA